MSGGVDCCVSSFGCVLDVGDDGVRLSDEDIFGGFAEQPSFSVCIDSAYLFWGK